MGSDDFEDRDRVLEMASRAYDLVVDAFEEAYELESEDDRDDIFSSFYSDDEAIDYLENIAEPLMQYFHGLRGDLNLDYLDELLEDGFERRGDCESYSFHLNVDSEKLSELYDDVRGRFEPDEFDYVVGVFAGGMLPMSLLNDYLDAEPVVLRYSHFRREDKEVIVSERMAERVDFSGSDVLVVDDILRSGETVENIGRYVMDKGASSVYALPVYFWPLNKDMRNNVLLGVNNLSGLKGLFQRIKGHKVELSPVEGA